MRFYLIFYYFFISFNYITLFLSSLYFSYFIMTYDYSLISVVLGFVTINN